MTHPDPGAGDVPTLAQMAEPSGSGRSPTPGEMTACHARHDQAMVDV